jgi:hypothetical protein
MVTNFFRCEKLLQRRGENGSDGDRCQGSVNLGAFHGSSIAVNGPQIMRRYFRHYKRPQHDDGQEDAQSDQGAPQARCDHWS